MKRLLAMMFLLCSLGYAAQTTINQTMTLPNGTPLNGTAFIKLSAACMAGSTYIDTKEVAVTFIGGAFSTALYPNDTCTQLSNAGTTYYTVRWNTCPATTQGTLSKPCSTTVPIYQSTALWIVATSSTPVNFANIITGTVPSIQMPTLLPTQITSGGAVVGQCLVFNGTSWAPGSCGSSAQLSWATLTSSSWASLTTSKWSTLVR